MFNIFLNDIFFFLTINLANFADDNSPYTVEKDIKSLLKVLESETCEALKWFRINEMKPNQGKCHLMVAEINHKNYTSDSFVFLENAFLQSENSVKLLGVTIDKNLNFEMHISNIFKESNNKLHALKRIQRFLLFEKKE